MIHILTAKLSKKLFQITLLHFVFLPVIVLLRFVHARGPHADLFAVLFDLLLAVGLEQCLHTAELLFFVLFLFHEFNYYKLVKHAGLTQ